MSFFLSGSGESTSVKRDVFNASHNQQVFTLSELYKPLENRLIVFVDGVIQAPPENFTETSTNSFTLAEGVSAETLVVAIYY